MKKFIVLLILSLSGLCAKSQSVESENKVLVVEREKNNHKVIYTFRPGKKLLIKTTDKVTLYTTNYSFLDNAIVLNNLDTITFTDIARIKGKVFDNKGRKTLGVVIAVISIPAALAGGFITGWTIGSQVVGAIPFVGTFVVGISMLGARKFNTSDKWNLVLSQK
jgi:hypothetical protein